MDVWKLIGISVVQFTVKSKVVLMILPLIEGNFIKLGVSNYSYAVELIEFTVGAKL